MFFPLEAPAGTIAGRTFSIESGRCNAKWQISLSDGADSLNVVTPMGRSLRLADIGSPLILAPHFGAGRRVDHYGTRAMERCDQLWSGQRSGGTVPGRRSQSLPVFPARQA